MTINEIIAKELNISVSQVEKTVALIDEGNTIPFIARYRKEVTGSLDDTVLRTLEDRLTYLRNIEKRREEVKALIDAQGKLTDELVAAIDKAETLTEIDDIYRPYRPKRKTRASVAREKGLEGLAKLIMEQRKTYEPALEVQAEEYVNEEKGVSNIEEAFAGACDIIAEDVSDNAEYRKQLRAITFSNGVLTTKAANAEAESVYQMYYDYAEPVKKVPDHRILAINRGEKEEFLKVSIELPEEFALNYLFSELVDPTKIPRQNTSAPQLSTVMTVS